MKLLPLILGSAFAQTQSEILDLKKRTFLQEIELDAILQLQVWNNLKSRKRTWNFWIFFATIFFRITFNLKTSTWPRGSLKAWTRTGMIIRTRTASGATKPPVSLIMSRVLAVLSGNLPHTNPYSDRLLEPEAEDWPSQTEVTLSNIFKWRSLSFSCRRTNSSESTASTDAGASPAAPETTADSVNRSTTLTNHAANIPLATIAFTIRTSEARDARKILLTDTKSVGL